MNRTLHAPSLTTAPLLPLAASLIGGIVAGYYWTVGEFHSLLALVAVLLVTLLLHRFPRWQTAGICLCVALAGLHLSNRQLRRLHTLPQSHDLVVASAPVDKGKTVVMDALTADGKKVRLRMMKGARLHIGDGLMVANDITPISYYPLYFDSHGYSGEVFVGHGQWEGRRVSLACLSTLQRTRLRLLRIRSHLTERYQSAGITNASYAVIAAMTLGDKSSLTPDIRDTYAITGASHILALSGLHLGIIYWLVTLLMVGRRWRMAAQVVTILAIWAFAFLTGLSPSVVRSAIMLTVYALLSIGYRQGASVNVLAFTAIVMLVTSPLSVFDIGFQMSFLAVLSILLFHPLLYGLIPLPWLQRHTAVRWLWGLTVLSVSAQMGVAPLIAFYFHRFSTYFLLSNFIVVPEAYLILVGALVLLLSGSTLVATALTAVASLANRLLGVVASLPMASIERLQPSVLQTLMVYVVIGCIYFLLLVFRRSRSISLKATR